MSIKIGKFDSGNERAGAPLFFHNVQVGLVVRVAERKYGLAGPLVVQRYVALVARDGGYDESLQRNDFDRFEEVVRGEGGELLQSPEVAKQRIKARVRRHLGC